MIVEPVQGYGGISPLLHGYIGGAAERVRGHGGVLIIDEVQAGFGRTGDNFWSFEAHDVVPEIVVMAKGISNGFPLGALVAQRHVAEAMAEKFLFHTYGANPVSCAAGRAVLKIIERDGVQENARVVGAALLEGLRGLQDRYDVIGDVRGLGLMLAIELVTDRRTKEPAAAITADVFEEAITADVFEETRYEGLVVSKSGPHRNVLRIVPPCVCRLTTSKPWSTVCTRPSEPR